QDRRSTPRGRAVPGSLSLPLSVLRLAPALGLRILLRASPLLRLLARRHPLPGLAPPLLRGLWLRRGLRSAQPPRRMAPPGARAGRRRPPAGGDKRAVKTVLVVDDEPQIAEIACDYLRLAG